MPDSSKSPLAQRTFAVVMSLLLAFPAVGALAQDIQVAGITVADHVSVAGQKLLLNGAGLRTLLGFHVYVAALYLPVPTHETAQILERDMPKRLQLTLLRDTTTEQNVEALKAGLNGNNSAVELEAIKSEVALFFALIQQMREVSTGTVIQLDYLPDAGTIVRIGGRNLGIIPGERFNRAILKIWLGVEPTQRSLKKALLGSESMAEHALALPR